jgi:hypothetical protein
MEDRRGTQPLGMSAGKKESGRGGKRPDKADEKWGAQVQSLEPLGRVAVDKPNFLGAACKESLHRDMGALISHLGSIRWGEEGLGRGGKRQFDKADEKWGAQVGGSLGISAMTGLDFSTRPYRSVHAKSLIDDDIPHSLA